MWSNVLLFAKVLDQTANKKGFIEILMELECRPNYY